MYRDAVASICGRDRQLNFDNFLRLWGYMGAERRRQRCSADKTNSRGIWHDTFIGSLI